MSRRREAARPPDLPGYTVQRLLGTGGSADVFLYEQERPHRLVAVKVLLDSADAETREAFEREADLTARLSHHPSIVTIHQAGVTGDGRPYLVMEYCSRPGLGDRFRTERLEVAEVLQLGVRLASAVETAHRAGIVHRDIKPANVLTTDLGRPVLSDFGIAGAADAEGPVIGMSIPWAAPELLTAVPTGDERSDIYSLAATLYSALAGRSPFERPGGANDAADLMARIEGGTPVPPARDDLPDRLRTVLARAMAHDAWQRYARAVDLAHDLRAVEVDLGLPPTPLDVPDDPVAPGAATAAEADATHVRRVIEVDPRPAGMPGAPRGAGATRPGPVASVPADGPDAVTGNHPPVRDVPPGGATDRRPGRLVVAAGSIVAVVGVAVAVVLLANRPAGGPPQGDDEFPAPIGTVAATVPSPTGLAGDRQPDGTVTFTWTNPDEQDGDRYLWGVLAATGEPQLRTVTQPRVTVTPAEAGEVCVEVSIVRADRRASAVPAQVCVP